MIDWLTPARRQRLYNILASVMPLLALYGLVTDQQATLWLALLGAVLGNATAAVFTNTGRGTDSDPVVTIKVKPTPEQIAAAIQGQVLSAVDNARAEINKMIGINR